MKKAAIALHNCLRTEESAVYWLTGYTADEDGSENLIPELWRDGEVATGLLSIGTVNSNRYTLQYNCILIPTLTLIPIVKLDPYSNLDSHFNFQMNNADTPEQLQTSEISLWITFAGHLMK